jgi:hypothetical protein
MSELQELRNAIPEWRAKAIALWERDPIRWQTFSGVPLADYLEQLQKLERVIDQITTSANDVRLRYAMVCEN